MLQFMCKGKKLIRRTRHHHFPGFICIFRPFAIFTACGQKCNSIAASAIATQHLHREKRGIDKNTGS